MRRARLVGATAMLLGLAVCGAGPADEGTEYAARIGGGWYEQQRGGCGGAPTYLYRVRHLDVSGTARHRFEDSGALLSAGVGLTSETDVESRLVDDGDTPAGEEPDPPDMRSGALVLGTIRGGYQWSWFGFEAGPMWGAHTRDGAPDTPYPSASIWFVPVDGLSLFASLLEDPDPYVRGYLRIGFGWRQETWGFSLSGGTGVSGAIGLAEVELEVADRVWLSAGGSITAPGELGPEVAFLAGLRFAAL